MSRSGRRRPLILFGLAVLAILLQGALELTRRPVRQRDYAEKLAAAQKADEAFTTLRRHLRMEGAEIDKVNDPAGTGLVGPEFSLITNARGDLEAKLSSLNPNWAAVLVELFHRAGLRPGDPVAVAVTGSFPGLNVALYAALETMELAPVVITSVGASMWGANDPSFTWLDMERILREERVLHVRTSAATLGGGDDMGQGLSPEGRRLLEEAITRNGVPLLGSLNIEEAISKRMSFFDEALRGRVPKCFVNVGGGVASLGSSQNRILIPRGFAETLEAKIWPRKGTLTLMSDRGVPVIHLLEVASLAREYGLPVAPDYLPEPGEGEIFVRDGYRLELVAVFLVIYGALCAVLLAPEVRRNLLGAVRFRRRAGGAA
jgi:poly-gamma-glutamate system protein